MSPRGVGGGAWDRVGGFHFVSVNSSWLSAFADALRPFAGIIPSQVEGESGPSQNNSVWW